MAVESDDDAVRTLNVALERFRGDPRQALGLAAEADAGLARAVFHELSKRFHPAKFARYSPGTVRLANEVFLAIKRAYEAVAAVAPAQPRPVNAPAAGPQRAATAPYASLGQPPPRVGTSPYPTQPPPRAGTAPYAAVAPPSGNGDRVPPRPPSSSSERPPGPAGGRPAPTAASSAPPAREKTQPIPRIAAPPPPRPTPASSTQTPPAGMPRLQPPPATAVPAARPHRPTTPAPAAAPAPAPAPTTRPAVAPGARPAGASAATPAAPPAAAAPAAPTAAAGPARPTKPTTPPPRRAGRATASDIANVVRSRERFENALQLLREQRWTDARASFAELAAEEPTDARYRAYLHYTRGWEAFQLGKDGEARAEWQRALAADPSLGLARWALESTHQR